MEVSKKESSEKPLDSRMCGLKNSLRGTVAVFKYLKGCR